MADNSLINTTSLIQWFGWAFMVLLTLLALVQAALFWLRHLARQHVTNTDLDLIGLSASVAQTIRPGKAGKISLSVENGDKILLDAESDNKISIGRKAKIIAINNGRYRVVPEKSSASARGDAKKKVNPDGSVR